MAASNLMPAYDHIVVVVEENHSFGGIIGNPQAPYINSLASGGALLTNYHAITHPSQPNYFALYAGSTFGVADFIRLPSPAARTTTVRLGAWLTRDSIVRSGGFARCGAYSAAVKAPERGFEPL